LPAFAQFVELLASAAAVAMILLASFGLGRPLARWRSPRDTDRLQIFVWSVGAGLVVAGGLLLVLAALELLYEPVIWLMTVIAACWSMYELCTLRCATLAVESPDARSERGSGAPVSPAAKVTLACAGAVLVWSLISACAPPTSAEVLSRSLAVPKNLLAAHGLDGPAGGWNLAQAWSLWALALDGPVAANLLYCVLGALVALATVLLARPIVGAGVAWVAGSIALVSPGVAWQLGVPLEELPLALVAALAIAAVCEALRMEDADRAAVTAGGMAGAAASIHLDGVHLVAALVAICLYDAWRLPALRRNSLAVARSLLLSAALVAAPWWICAGPPLAPGADSLEMIAALGPAIGIALGGVVFARRLWGLSRIMLLGGLIAVLVVIAPWPAAGWPLLVPLASVLAAWVWSEARRLPLAAQHCAAWACLLLVVAGLRLPAARAWQSLAVATGRQSRQAYLLEHEPTYRAASLVNQIRRSGQRLFSQDARGLYFACVTGTGACVTATGAAPSKKSLAAVDAGESQELIAWARAMGYAYLLLAEAVEEPDASAQQATAGNPRRYDAEPLAEQLDATGKVIPILEYCFADDNNRSIRYRLLKLPGPRLTLPRDSTSEAESAVRSPRFPTR